MGIVVPSGLDEIIETFGDIHDVNFERDNIVAFMLPYPLVYGTSMVTKSRGHKKAIGAFEAAFELIVDRDLKELATHYSGIYANRNIRGFPRFPSTHSWGIAIDVNAEKNALGSVGTQDTRVIACFTDVGFVWGGTFVSRRDPMHFQLARHY